MNICQNRLPLQWASRRPAPPHTVVMITSRVCPSPLSLPPCAAPIPVYFAIVVCLQTNNVKPWTPLKNSWKREPKTELRSTVIDTTCTTSCYDHQKIITNKRTELSKETQLWIVQKEPASLSASNKYATLYDILFRFRCIIKKQAKLFTVESAAAYVIYCTFYKRSYQATVIFVCKYLKTIIFLCVYLMCEKFYVLFRKRCREVYKGLSPSSLALRSHRMTRRRAKPIIEICFQKQNKLRDKQQQQKTIAMKQQQCEKIFTSQTDHTTDRMFRSFVRSRVTDRLTVFRKDSTTTKAAQNYSSSTTVQQTSHDDHQQRCSVHTATSESVLNAVLN